MRSVDLAPYEDDDGNRVIFTGLPTDSIKFTFRGKNNVAHIHPDAIAKYLHVDFNSNNGTFVLGANPHKRGFSAGVRVGEDAEVRIGTGVSSTSSLVISAVEGTTVDIGDDVMFASHNQVRSDDGHPIFDISTGKRINPARSIRIGPHVWLGWGSIVLAGVKIGEGTVVGANSIVTKNLPNNVVAVGSPARTVRKNIAWERPHLGLTAPYYKPDASTVTKSKYWRYTVDPDAPIATSTSLGRVQVRRVARRAGRIWRTRRLR